MVTSRDVQEIISKLSSENVKALELYHRLRQFHWSLLYEKTRNKKFLMWICSLVYSLIGYNTDVILRLCQDIMLLKAEVAELLLPSVIVDLARKKNTDIDLRELISLQYAKPSTCGSESCSTSTKAKYSIATSSAVALSTSSWDKICGSYLTSMMYVEYWCEENFNGVTLGRPDFSHLEVAC